MKWHEIGFLISKKTWGSKPEKFGFDKPFGLIGSNTQKSQVCSTWQIYGLRCITVQINSGFDG